MDAQAYNDKMEEAYVAFFNTMNAKTRRYLHSRTNAETIGAKVIELTNGDENKLLEAGAWLAAWAVCQAEGTIEEPPIDPEAVKKANFEAEEKVRRRNVELEKRDREAGNTATPRGHMSEDERNKLEAEAQQNLQANVKKLLDKVKAGITPVEQEELSASDCLYALTGGDPKTPLTREKVQTWLNKWPAALCRSVRTRQSNIRERMDEVLKTGVDPMIGVETNA